MTKNRVANEKLGNPVTNLVTGQYLKENGKQIAIGGLMVASFIAIPYFYKKWRRDNYAQKHANNPNVQAAMFIRRAVTKIDILFLDKTLWTDQKAIMQTAKKITNFGEVVKAYRIMYQSDLMKDIQGLNDKDLNLFFRVVNGKQYNQNLNEIILTGEKVYCAVRDLSIRQAKQVDGKWKSTDKLYGKFSYMDEVGEVVANVLYQREPLSRFYIVKKGLVLKDYGLVFDKNITNKRT